jgi:transposase InsO family protein
MKEHRFRYPVGLMARVLEVSRSGYYAWLNAAASKRTIRHNLLGPIIEQIHIDSRKTYGSRRIVDELKSRGMEIGRDQISRLRKKMGLWCVQKAKFKATTNSDHNLPVAPNLLEQDFTTEAPGQVWGADITYISTGEGWLYLAAVKDFHTKEVVGQAMGDRMTKELVMEALRKALKYRSPMPGCIIHSDRGSQYCASDYQKMIGKAGLRASMSRRGNCYDNAPTESLWSSLKTELVYHKKFLTRLEASAAIREYIEIFYNRIRRHSSIGNVAPAVFADKYYAERRKAA